MKTNRYPGVKPFSENERHLFYGRSNDTKKLFQLISLEKLVLLYSKSGLGKSSLLNAGVLPLFVEEEGYTTVKIRFGASYGQSLSPVTTSLFKLPEAPSNPALDKLGAGSDTLWLRMKALQFTETDQRKTFILVFDQFEELFTYSDEDIKQFKRQLADLLYAKVPSYISKSITNRLREEPAFLSNEELEFLYRQLSVKVVMSIRSDRMSLLNSLADYLPDIQKNYYELKPLDRNSAIESIVKPAADKSDLYLSPTFAYTSDCINKILDYLTQDGQKSIETFQLQTVCQYAENLALEKQLQFDEQKQLLLVEADKLGDLQNIFRTQYDKLIGNIEPAAKQLAARLLIENKLIIDGNRVSLPDVVVLKEKGIDKELLAYLHDTYHILRSEPNTTGGISYELSHDTLVAPILKAKKEREDKEELAQLEAERQEELKLQKEKSEKERVELAKTRKRLRVVYGLLGLALLAMVAAGYFGYNAKKSEKATSVALAKSEKLINAFYFYKDRFALAFKNGSFYFIDKNGDPITKLGKWENAEQFDQNGFAKVKEDDSRKNFVIDTSGKEYKAAFDIEEIDSTTEYVDFSEYNFEEIPIVLFKCQNLHGLILSHKYLYNLPQEIGELKNLTILDLNFNHIDSLPKEIGNLKKLKSLGLVENKMDNLPKEIGELENLTFLDLALNNFDSLPKEIWDLKNLTILNLEENQLTSLPKEIGKLKNLTTLSLNGNNLDSLPKEIGTLKNLTSLDLGGTSLTSLPKEIGELKNLKSLDLRSCNSLTSLPKEIWELKNLTTLNLSRCDSLTSLPKEIWELKNLTTLYLGSNKLTSLPKEIGELKNLKELYLNNNELALLPKEIGELKNLEELYLDYNELALLPKEIGELKNLKKLVLKNNKLTSLPKKIWELENLEKFYLDFNKLASLPEEIGELKNLKFLYLYKTKIPETEIIRLQKLLPNCNIEFKDEGDPY